MAISLETLSSIREAARNTVRLEMCLSTSGIPLVRVYGGIVDGVQVVECDNEDDRLEAFNDLYSFYRRLGKTVRMFSWQSLQQHRPPTGRTLCAVRRVAPAT